MAALFVVAAQARSGRPMIALSLTEDSLANLKVAERLAVLRIEPAEKRGDRWVISATLGERTAYLSDDTGIALFQSVNAATKFIQATRPDLAEGVEVGVLVEGKAPSRPGDPASGSADREHQP
jgi:hypothetical protein